MKKTIFALATLALFALEAEQFEVKTSVTSSSDDAQTPEYLVQFEINQINENSDPVEFTKPSIICPLGKEGKVNKFVDGRGGYTVKALVYQEDDKIKVKTSVTILDAEKKEIFREEVVPR